MTVSLIELTKEFKFLEVLKLYKLKPGVLVSGKLDYYHVNRLLRKNRKDDPIFNY